MTALKTIRKVILAGLVTGAVAWAAETASKPQTTCPVMGGKINKELYADVDGKRVYVCCGGCIASVKKDPAKYIGKLEEAGVVLEKVPVTEQE